MTPQNLHAGRPARGLAYDDDGDDDVTAYTCYAQMPSTLEFFSSQCQADFVSMTKGSEQPPLDVVQARSNSSRLNDMERRLNDKGSVIETKFAFHVIETKII